MRVVGCEGTDTICCGHVSPILSKIRSVDIDNGLNFYWNDYYTIMLVVGVHNKRSEESIQNRSCFTCPTVVAMCRHQGKGKQHNGSKMGFTDETSVRWYSACSHSLGNFKQVLRNTRSINVYCAAVYANHNLQINLMRHSKADKVQSLSPHLSSWAASRRRRRIP